MFYYSFDKINQWRNKSQGQSLIFVWYGTIPEKEYTITYKYIFFYLQIGTLMKATSDDANPPPGYIYDQVASILFCVLLFCLLCDYNI